MKDHADAPSTLGLLEDGVAGGMISNRPNGET